MAPVFLQLARQLARATTVFDAAALNDHVLGRSVGGFSSKVHLVTDGNGVPLNATLTKRQTHESTQFEATLEPIAIHRRRTNRLRRYPKRRAGDRAYHAKRIRQWLRRCGIRIVTLQCGRPLTYNTQHYCGRNVVERLLIG